MVSGIAVAGGLLSAVAAGLAGASFTVPTRKEPELGWLGVKGSWEWSNTWLIFTVWNVIVNLVLAACFFGLGEVTDVYSGLTHKSQLAILLSSAFWAFGTVLFGLGVDLSGVAMGVGLAMTSQVMFGTALPLISEGNAGEVLLSARGGLLITGIALSIVGFGLLGWASRLRDRKPRRGVKGAKSGSVQLAREPLTETSSLQGADMHEVSLEEAKVDGNGVEGEKEAIGEGPKLWLGVMVSLFAGLLSALLQYAFVFGKEAVDTIQAPPYSESPLLASAIIWTVATAVNNIVQTAYMIGSVTYHGLWHLYVRDPPSIVWANVGRCFIMAVLLNAHVELYGLSQALLGKLGPVVSWPLTMSLVVLMSQVWGYFLNEWKGASREALRVYAASISTIVMAVVLLGISSGL